MRIPEPVPERLARLAGELRRTHELRVLGRTPRELAQLVRLGELVRIRRGWYLPASYWAALHAEDRQLALIHIVQTEATAPPVFSHYSAAALHGLPLDDDTPPVVHVITSPGRRGGAERSIVRHRVPLTESEITRVGPHLCTDAERTVFDVALIAPRPLALGCADGLLRETCRIERLIDQESWNAWRARMLRRAEERAGHRGIRAARWIATHADPRSDSHLESRSRYFLEELGFTLNLQVPVVSPTGSNYYVDFELLGLDLFGECDGKQKYVDARLRNGKTADEVLYDEKRRDDWISGHESKRVIHWGHPDLVTIEHFSARLTAFSVPIPRPVRRLRQLR